MPLLMAAYRADSFSDMRSCFRALTPGVHLCFGFGMAAGVEAVTVLLLRALSSSTNASVNVFPEVCRR